MFTFSVLDLILQVVSKNSIWDFDVTQLISQQFTHRDLKPVVFLVYSENAKILTRSNSYYQRLVLVELPYPKTGFGRSDLENLLSCMVPTYQTPSFWWQLRFQLRSYSLDLPSILIFSWKMCLLTEIAKKSFMWKF